MKSCGGFVLLFCFTILVHYARGQISRSIEKIHTAHQQKEGGGFMIRRPIGSNSAFGTCDPFLMLDHMGPSTYGPGEAVGAPDHPHRGFETVTYMLQGGFQHKDSQGNHGDLRPGWVQWMTAGSGVVHSEMPSDDIIANGGTVEGFQLWVNLPAKYKMIKPRYQDTPPEKIPVVYTPDQQVRVKIIAGESLGTSAVIETKTPIMYLDIHINRGASFVQKIPASYNGFAYVYRGSGAFGSNKKVAKMGQVIGFGTGDVLEASAPEEDCKFLLLAGVPIKEPIAQHGPFVMNTQEELRQAFSDYQRGLMGQIQGSEERYEKTRQAVNKQKETGKWDRDL